MFEFREISKKKSSNPLMFEVAAETECECIEAVVVMLRGFMKCFFGSR